jgi:hypothetical protein
VRSGASAVEEKTVNAPKALRVRVSLRGLCRALAAVLVVLTLTSVAVAQESRVLLVYPDPSSALLGEALVHVRGELGSVGLSVQVITTTPDQEDFRPDLLPGTYGALVFEERPGLLIMRAYHPGSPEPTTQQLATHDGRITPHVAGVRAVETLRAALQQYYYTADNPEVPEPVKKLARINESPQPPPRAPPPPAPPPRAPPPRAPPPPAPPPPPPAPRSAVEADLWLAPSVQVDALNARVAGAGSLGLSVGHDWWFAMLALESTLIPFELRAESGSAQIHRHAGALEFQSRLYVSDSACLFAELGAGAAQYRVEGTSAPGYTSNQAEHWTAFGVVGLGAEYRVTSRFGLFLLAEASAALDAPYVRFTGLPGEQFERPLLSFALGATLGVVR